MLSEHIAFLNKKLSSERYALSFLIKVASLNVWKNVYCAMYIQIQVLLLHFGDKVQMRKPFLKVKNQLELSTPH